MYFNCRKVHLTAENDKFAFRFIRHQVRLKDGKRLKSVSFVETITIV